ncbi:MAG: preprotein translocase subunit SecA [Clostridiales bacterium]|nr:preprotein translocase subunit SecA [Clostridiales bacterium]
MGLINTLFGTYSARQVKKLLPIVNAIEALSDQYASMSDTELREQTDVLRQRLSQGESLDDILPDAFAVVREADDRVLGKRPFRVQLIGGIVLHQGRIAEMKTGEGKTLVATLPAYLNALTGQGVHIVTVNEYLARVGSEEMGRVYNFLGLSCGLICHGQTPAEKQAAYGADITYGTNNEYGFDYLRDNMVIYKERMVQRGHAFAIVDEVDSILIDEARTPLIISGEGEKSTAEYDRAAHFVSKLKEFRIKELENKEYTEDVVDTGDADYIVDEKARTAVLTANGIAKAENYYNVENFTDDENSTLYHHVTQAIKARGVMKRDVDYVLKDGQILIVDSFTGRIMPGRRYNEGLHQAIEAKEGVKVQKESRTLASITFQNFFRLYHKLSGMTGTALTEETEFREIYQLDVVEVPTNMPMIRKDHNDVVYKSVAAKYDAIVEQVKACHEKGQPVLVGTVSVEKSEELSKKLAKNGIKHTVLNAKHHEKEAEIVAMAGKLGTVTIATNMAGRGTDIMLGGNPEFLAKQEMRRLDYEEDIIGAAMGTADTDDEEILAARAVFKELYDRYKKEIEPEYEKVVQAGGLFIIGTERHESRRIDNQLRGRSGRQGDPGETRFYLSLEDDLMRLFGSERILSMVNRLGLPDDQPIDAKILSNSIESAQKRLEDQNFTRRKHVLEYDDVMNQQRNIIYAQRKEVLDGADLHDKILTMMKSTVEELVNISTASELPEEWNFEQIKQDLRPLCTPDDFQYTNDDFNTLTAESIKELLNKRALDLYAQKEAMFAEEGMDMREIERVILLQAVDMHWMAHLDNMDALKGGVGLNAYAQRNPITEYRIAGADMFEAMVNEIREDTVRAIWAVMPKKAPVERKAVAKVTSEGFEGAGGEKKKQTPVKAEQKVGRNDPCPCGSGKKYKKCCGQ